MDLEKTGAPDPKAPKEIRQVIRSHRRVQERIQPGQTIFEMVVNPDPVTGSFDPELALVRPAEYMSAAVMGQPVVEGLGPVKPGTKRKLIVTPGNFYQVALNAENARSKIIKKYFSNL